MRDTSLISACLKQAAAVSELSFSSVCLTTRVVCCDWGLGPVKQPQSCTDAPVQTLALPNHWSFSAPESIFSPRKQLLGIERRQLHGRRGDKRGGDGPCRKFVQLISARADACTCGYQPQHSNATIKSPKRTPPSHLTPSLAPGSLNVAQHQDLPLFPET